MKTYPQHIQDEANKMLAKGAKMSFEAICDMYMKKENKKYKAFKAVPVNPVALDNNDASNWLAEKNRENAYRNRPSSMR